jgi:hypothetical protein
MGERVCRCGCWESEHRPDGSCKYCDGEDELFGSPICKKFVFDPDATELMELLQRLKDE